MIEMEEQFRRGRLLLDKLELFDAENLFREILQRATPADNVEKRKYVIEAMAGIAECESKRCQLRRTRKKLDWFCGMLFAQCLYQEAGELCAQVLRAMEEARIPEKSAIRSLFDRRCFQDIQSKLASQLRVVEEQFVSSMKVRVLENCVGVGKPGRSNHFKDDWLQNLLQACRTKDYDRLDFDEGGSDRIDHSHDDDVFLDIEGLNTSTEALYDAEWERRFLQTPDIDLRSLLGKKKVNFDRFQDAIQQLVSEVSKEIRSKYQHMSGDIPQGLINRRLSSELAMGLSPGSKDAIDLINVFEESMTEEDEELPESDPEEKIEIKPDGYDSGAESSEEDEDSFETIQLDIAPSALHEYTWRPEQSQLPVALTNGTLTPEAAQQKFNCLAKRIDAMVVTYNNTTASDNNSKVVAYGNTKASDNNSKIVTYGNKNNCNNLKGTDSNLGKTDSKENRTILRSPPNESKVVTIWRAKSPSTTTSRSLSYLSSESFEEPLSEKNASFRRQGSISTTTPGVHTSDGIQACDAIQESDEVAIGIIDAHVPRSKFCQSLGFTAMRAAESF